MQVRCLWQKSLDRFGQIAGADGLAELDTIFLGDVTQRGGADIAGQDDDGHAAPPPLAQPGGQAQAAHAPGQVEIGQQQVRECRALGHQRSAASPSAVVMT